LTGEEQKIKKKGAQNFLYQAAKSRLRFDCHAALGGSVITEGAALGGGRKQGGFLDADWKEGLGRGNGKGMPFESQNNKKVQRTWTT